MVSNSMERWVSHMETIKRRFKFNPVLWAAIILFIVYLPLAKSVDFKQNDDWVYYENAQTFLKGDLTLDSYMGPTFYTQGLLGAGFIKLFGESNLPVLSLIFSVLSYYLFTLILKRFLKRTKVESIVLGLLLFLNPLNIHSFLGFMTESYFLFFMLLSVYIFLICLEKPSLTNFGLLLITILLAFFVRQITLFLPLGFLIYCIYAKKYGLAVWNFVMFSLLSMYYMFFFPLTSAMLTKAFSPHHLLESEYAYTLIYGMIILLSAFLIPLLLDSLNPQQGFTPKKILLALILFLGIYWILNTNFDPHRVSWGEFPYFENPTSSNQKSPSI